MIKDAILNSLREGCPVFPNGLTKALMQNTGSDIPYEKAEFTTRVEDGNLVVSYSNADNYPPFKIVDGNLVATFEDDRPMRLYIDGEGNLREVL